jgi:predicted esterase
MAFCVVILIGLSPLKGAGAEALTADLSPGSEVKIKDPTGWRGYFKLYIPKDYTPDHAWPVVLWYHGANGRPGTGPLRRMAEGRGAIIIGMDYSSKEYHDRIHPPELVAEEKQHAVRVVKIVNQLVNIDTDRIFMGGFSLGGFSTTVRGEAMASELSGFLLMGSSRNPGDDDPVPRAMRGMPVYMAHGSNDSHVEDQGKRTARLYRRGGVDLTYEVWEGLGHRAKTDCKVFDKWWRRYVQRPTRVRALKAARRLAQRRPGQAYPRLTELAQTKGKSTPVAQRAEQAAERIAQKVEQRHKQVEQLRANGQVERAVRRLTRITQRYAGTKFAKQAKERLSAMQQQAEPDSKLAEKIRRARAASLRRRVQAAKREDKPARAIELYETYLNNYPDAEQHARVQRQMKRLKQSERVQRTIRNAEAAETCKPLLQWANVYMRCRNASRARKVLQYVEKQYPETKWAERAGNMLARFQ